MEDQCYISQQQQQVHNIMQVLVMMCSLFLGMTLNLANEYNVIIAFAVAVN